VLIDFDACHPDGAQLTKRPQLGYKQTKSSTENDWHGLTKVTVEIMLREVVEDRA